MLTIFDLPDAVKAEPVDEDLLTMEKIKKLMEGMKVPPIIQRADEMIPWTGTEWDRPNQWVWPSPQPAHKWQWADNPHIKYTSTPNVQPDFYINISDNSSGSYTVATENLINNTITYSNLVSSDHT